MRTRLLALLVVACSMAALIPSVASASSARSQMFSAINGARVSAGLPALKRYSRLGRSSDRYAKFMVSNDVWAHAANPARGARLGYVGEILGMTTTADPAPQAILQAWLASPVHRPIIMDRRYRYVGFGLRHGTMDGMSSWVWVVRFGAR